MEQIIIGPLNPKLQMPEMKLPRSEGGNSSGFGEMLKDAISTVNEVQKQSDQQIQKLMTGESKDLHTTVIAMQKADLSFQMMMQVRNKIVQAYQEIMRMQV